jgi:hypothetical protein
MDSGAFFWQRACMADVVSLKGEPIAPRGEPREDIALELEELAARARAGELDGVVATLLFQDNSTSYRIKGRVTRAMIGVLEMVKFQLLHDDMEESL